MDNAYGNIAGKVSSRGIILSDECFFCRDVSNGALACELIIQQPYMIAMMKTIDPRGLQQPTKLSTQDGGDLGTFGIARAW